MKKILCLIITLIIIISTTAPLMAYAAEATITVYAMDGRTAKIPVSKKDAYLKVGWYDSPVITMYAEDGRTKKIPSSQKEAYEKVGWYDGPVITVYAADGRTKKISSNDKAAYLKVGWYDSPVITVYAADGRTKKISSNDKAAYLKVGWYDSPIITMYAEDGRTKKIPSSKKEAYEKVGWYDGPVITVYAADGRTKKISSNDKAAYLKVGWYDSPVITVYAADGRTKKISSNDKAAYLKVGWYDVPVVKIGIQDGRTKIIPASKLEAYKNVGWFALTPNSIICKVGNQNIYAYEIYYLTSMGYDVDTAIKEMTSIKVMFQKATEYGIYLSEYEIEAVEEDLDTMIAQYGGKSSFEKILSSFHLTFAQYKAIMILTETVEKFNGQVAYLGLFKEATEAEARAFFNNNFIKAKHILFSTVNTKTGDALPKEEAAAKHTLAKETLAKIKAGENFDNFAILNDDPGSAAQPEGYIFAVTAKITDSNILDTLQQVGFCMVPEFEKGAYNLNVGAISNIVSSSYGYHIIKRVAITAADFEKVKQKIINVLNNAKYLSLIEEWTSKYPVQKTLVYKAFVNSLK